MQSIEEIEKLISQWENALKTDLPLFVRETTEEYIKKGKVMIERLKSETPINYDPTHLKGDGYTIEVEKRTNEKSMFVDQAETLELCASLDTTTKKHVFFAEVLTREGVKKYTEAYVKGRIASILSEIVRADYFDLKKPSVLYSNLGFQSLSNWVTALGKIKALKCKVFDLEFDLLDVGDVYSAKNLPAKNSNKYGLFILARNYGLMMEKNKQTV